jgi:hypothetical protein
MSTASSVELTASLAAEPVNQTTASCCFSVARLGVPELACQKVVGN